MFKGNQLHYITDLKSITPQKRCKMVTLSVGFQGVKRRHPVVLISKILASKDCDKAANQSFKWASNVHLYMRPMLSRKVSIVPKMVKAIVTSMLEFTWKKCNIQENYCVKWLAVNTHRPAWPFWTISMIRWLAFMDCPCPAQGTEDGT